LPTQTTRVGLDGQRENSDEQAGNKPDLKNRTVEERAEVELRYKPGFGPAEPGEVHSSEALV